VKEGRLEGSVLHPQAFLIFHEIELSGPDRLPKIAFMIDHSHNLKGKTEAMVQT